MLLTGTFHRSLDEKLRIAVPKRLRDALPCPPGGGLFVAPGTDASLAIYSEEAFARLAERLAAASPTEREVRAFRRLFYGQAQRVELDRQGRVRIPPELAELARLEKEVVLLGVEDHLELWSAARWQAYVAEKQARYDEIAEAAFGPKKHREGRRIERRLLLCILEGIRAFSPCVRAPAPVHGHRPALRSRDRRRDRISRAREKGICPAAKCGRTSPPSPAFDPQALHLAWVHGRSRGECALSSLPAGEGNLSIPRRVVAARRRRCCRRGDRRSSRRGTASGSSQVLAVLLAEPLLPDLLADLFLRLEEGYAPGRLPLDHADDVVAGLALDDLAELARPQGEQGAVEVLADQAPLVGPLAQPALLGGRAVGAGPRHVRQRRPGEHLVAHLRRSPRTPPGCRGAWRRRPSALPTAPGPAGRNPSGGPDTKCASARGSPPRCRLVA